MANLRDIRRRIKSVKNTSQITKAMQLVAAAKMKKAQNQAVSGREYADELNRVLLNLKESADDEFHPLLAEQPEGKELMLVISTDKGLCGGLNTNLYKKVLAEAGDNSDFSTVGRKLHLQLAKSGKNVVSDWHVHDPVPFAETKPIAKYLTEQFLSSKYSVIKVAFSDFVSTLNQEPWVAQILPLREEKIAERRDYEKTSALHVSETDPEAAFANDYLFEPSPEKVLDTLLPLYINFQIYQMILEARASEHSARMVAMKSATDNAESMIKDLTLDYNKMRQASITSELLEITTAMKAME